MWTVGLDVHSKQSTYCVLDENGLKLRMRTVRGDLREVVSELSKLEQPFAICFEASTAYGVLFEKLTKVAARVLVAHPSMRVRLSSRAGIIREFQASIRHHRSLRSRRVRG